MIDPGFDYKSQPKEDVEACNLCGGSRFSVLSRYDRYRLPVWTLLCMGCGLGFISPRMTKQAYADFYSTGTYRKLSAQFSSSSRDPEKLRAAQRNYAAWIADFMWPHLKSSQAKAWIMDVGGGEGIVSRYIMDKFGYYASKVVDPSGESGEPVCFEDYEQNGKEYDLVLICQTIDHVLDLKGVLQKAHSMLSADGFMYVDIVDFPFVANLVGGMIGALKVDHPYSLSDTVMTAALTSLGFNIIQKDYSGGNHIAYLCQKSPYEKSQNTIFNPFYAARLLEDLRAIQARPRPKK